MKNLIWLWCIAFVISAFSISLTHIYMIMPVWVVNIIIAYYLIQNRKTIHHPLFSFVFSFSAVFLAAFFFDESKSNVDKALLALLGSVQINVFLAIYYWIAERAFRYKYFYTISVVIPNLISSSVSALLFMLLFKFGKQSYEFFDYFLEQFQTSVAVMTLLYGISHWRKIAIQDFAILLLAWLVQYFISSDPILYGCFIFPFVMCYFALKYKLKEMSFILGLLTFICSVYISIPLIGEYWSADETHMLSRLSSYRLALGCYLVIFLFIGEIYLNNRRLSLGYQQLMFRDELTGLMNRRFVRENIVANTSFKHGFILILDIDDFKKVNDAHGHYIGDLVIQHIGHILRQLKTSQAKIARWGGEEFLAVIPHGTTEQCHQYCQEILQACETQPFLNQDIKINISVSIGATMFKDFNQQSYEEVIQRADTLLYQAKAQGKKQYVFTEQ